jgi:hypothetical protein
VRRERDGAGRRPSRGAGFIPARASGPVLGLLVMVAFGRDMRLTVNGFAGGMEKHGGAAA